MNFQLYITRLKCLLRNKENMFWCYMFPIILASCFFFAFNNLWKIDDFETIKIAYNNEGVVNDELGSILNQAKMDNGTQMFHVTKCNKTKAKKLLEDGDIDAYIEGSKDPVLYIKSNSLNATITKSFLDHYKQMSDAAVTIMKENPKSLENGLMDDMMHYDEFLKEVKNKKDPNSILVIFYALLAYTCLFAANWGLDEVVNIQADLSARGARLNVSPMNKMKLFLSNLLAAFTAHLGSIIIMFLYMYYIIKVDFGSNLIYLFAICLLGALCGLVLGGTIGVWVKKKAEVKEAILVVAILGGGFLSGMMSPQIKYTIAEKFPILGYINPVNLVSDGMYSLYYYDTYHRFYLDAVILLILTLFLCIASYIGIRRKNYASL